MKACAMGKGKMGKDGEPKMKSKDKKDDKAGLKGMKKDTKKMPK